MNHSPACSSVVIRAVGVIHKVWTKRRDRQGGCDDFRPTLCDETARF